MRLLLKDQLSVWLQKTRGTESLDRAEKCASGANSQATGCETSAQGR